jgi:methanethiol oxidase
MPKLLPDQSFYPSPTMAMQAPVETLAYVALLNSNPSGSDALAVLDVDPASPGYGAQIARVNMPGAGDELHHFGWNVCSSCLCPNSPHPHMQRRYLVVPGMRSSRIHKVIEIPAEPAAADDLPPLLKGFGAVPPLVTDLNLSLDDRFL